MQKRLLLSIILSFFILYVWSMLVPKPQKQPVGLETTENIEGTGFSSSLDNTTATLSTVSTEVGKKTFQSKHEIINKLESDKLIARFSNIGGNLKDIFIKDYETSLPVQNLVNLPLYQSFEFKISQMDSHTIVYSYENDHQIITKSYSLSDDDYTIKSDVAIENKSDSSHVFSLDLIGISVDISNDRDKKINGINDKDKSLFEYILITDKKSYRKNNAYQFSSKNEVSGVEEVTLMGFRNRYYCALIKPQFNSQGHFIQSPDEKQLNIGLNLKDINISPGDSISFSSFIYVGPEDLKKLKEYGVGFEQSKKFYKFRVFDAIAKIIHGIMHVIHKVIPNWGVVIILMSIIIYFSMYPLTLKGMTSMKKMQELQPKIAALKEKYKNNPEKMNKEMMGIYKTQKINPLGGCLPFLFQTPVFIGLYQVLWRDVALKGAHFLWIKDLSAPDRLFTLPFHIPFMGNELNFLPLLMMVIMFFQQKITAKNMNTTNSAQMAQQKMISKIMPIFLGVIFYKFASGLTLYFTMFYVFSTFTQWKMSKDKKVA